jgi:hypothetical protein
MAQPEKTSLIFPSPKIEKQGDAAEDHKKSKDLTHGEGADDESELRIRLSEKFDTKTEQTIQAKKKSK